MCPTIYVQLVCFYDVGRIDVFDVKGTIDMSDVEGRVEMLDGG